MEPMVSIEQVAEAWAVSTRTIRRMIQRGDVTAYRIGGQLRFRESDVMAYVESAQVGA